MEIAFILLICASLVLCQQQPQQQGGGGGGGAGTLEELINQIFTPDNSGVNNNNANPSQNPYTDHSTIPTPVIVQGGQPTPPPPQPPVHGGGYEHEPTQPNGTPDIPSNSNPCDTGECVPYYQCANGTVITDGAGLLDIRFDPGRPCSGLFETCCTLRSETPIIPDDVKINSACGIRNADGVGFRITGDKDNESQFGEFPWTVALLKEEKALNGQVLNVYVCGGSLIDAGVVLTAAHCVHKKDPQTLKVRAGEWDTQTKDEIFPHQDRQVRDFVVHPGYYAGGLHNDIALLFLTEPVAIAENVNIVCLPGPADKFDGVAPCFASGWGKDTFGKEGKYQVILKRVELPIVPHHPCEVKLRDTRLGKHFQLHSSFICAGGERGRDTCKGDGGSPLVCHVNEGRYAQAGIVSWGIGCGDETPAVYVNVAIFRQWIDEQMNLHNLATSHYNL